MKSKTSFFNVTALRKDILRYSPVWALYTLFLLLTLFGFSDFSRAAAARTTLDSLKAMAWINLLYGGVCAAVLFSDLFKSRLCNALHAFPLRREGWLATHILSGVLFSLVPNLLATALGSLLLQEYAYMTLIWLGVSTLQYLFFFGTAVLCAMCAGNRLGMAAMYGIAHFITMLIYVVLQVLYQPLLYGVRLQEKLFFRFFPLSQMNGFDYADFQIRYGGRFELTEFNGLFGSHWLYVGLCALVGVGCLLLAGVLYRRRKLEAAGDFLAFRPLAPVFLVIATIGAGILLYLFSSAVGTTTYLFLALGMAVGYFAGSMLLYRTVKVFGKKSFLRFGVLAVALAASLGITWLDPLGVTTYIPEIDRIQSAAIFSNDRGYTYLAGSLLESYTGDYGRFLITDPEELAQLQDYHEQLISYRPASDDRRMSDVRVQYTLKSGKTVTRYYEVAVDSPLGKQAAKYLSDIRYVFEVNDPAVLYGAMKYVIIDVYAGTENTMIELTNPEEIAGLLDAIARDCAAGTMAQNWAFHDEDGKEKDYHLEFTIKESALDDLGRKSTQFHLKVYNDSTNTIAYMNEMIKLHAEQK